MSLSVRQIDDIMQSTYPYHYGRRSWKDLTQEMQEYTVVDRFLSQSKMPVEGGTHIEFMVRVNRVNNSRNSGLFDTQDYNIVDGFKRGTVDWTKYINTCIWDIDEKGFQEGGLELASVVDARTFEMEMGVVEKMEFDFWSLPTSASQNPMQPWGVPYWIVKNATAAFGFNGGNHANFPNGPAGIDASLYDKWRNGTGTYTAVDQDSFVKLICEATDKCYFKSPIKYNELDAGKPQHTLHTTYPVIQQCQDLLTRSNDNLKYDLGMFRDRVLIRGVPLVWTEALSNPESPAYDSTNPVYGIDWKNLKTVFRKGRDKKYTYVVDPDQVDVRMGVVRGWYNHMLTDRRKHFVVYQVAA